MKRNRLLSALIFSFLLFFLTQQEVFASGNGLIELKIGDEGELTDSVKVMLLVTVLTLAPSILIMFTCFTHVIIVLSLTRQGLGTMTIPPNQVLVGLALFITIFIMSPVIEEVNQKAYIPYQNGELDYIEAFKEAEKPIKLFMIKNTEENDLKTILRLKNEELPTKPEDVSIWAAVPSYALSQISKGLFTGLMIYVIFAFIDALVGAILMFMGMIMLPPQMLSLPIKLLIFVYVGGFTEVIQIIFGSIKV